MKLIMTKTNDTENKDLQKKLEAIIDRARAQNKVLNKVLEEIKSGKQVLKKKNENQ